MTELKVRVLWVIVAPAFNARHRMSEREIIEFNNYHISCAVINLDQIDIKYASESNGMHWMQLALICSKNQARKILNYSANI